MTASATSEAALAAFFGAAVDAFESAAAGGETRLDLVVAGRAVRVRIAGGALAHLARPLAHLRGAAAEPEFEILAWAGAPGPPDPPWQRRQVAPLGDVTGLPARFSASFFDAAGLLQAHDAGTRRAIAWLPRAEALPYWEVAAPFRLAFHWWAGGFGGRLAHAAAVGKRGAGVLITGKSGSGKSTTTVACLDGGLDCAGDDLVLLTGEPRPTAHSLYATAKLDREFMERAFPHWRPRVGGESGPERKALFFLGECLPEQVVDRLEIRAVVVPRVALEAEHASLVPISGAEAFLALGPTTMFMMPGAPREQMASLAGWLRRLPVRGLLSGRTPASIPAALAELLPVVSVVIPVFDGARFLAEAVASVRAQGVDVEIIVVDDGSRDGSFELAAAMPGVRALRQENAGPAAARNTGVRAATRDFLAFLDADDLWTPGKLAAQLAVFAADPTAGLVAGRVEEFGDDAEVAARGQRGERAYTFGALVVRRADWERIGDLDPRLRLGDLIEWRSRALAAGLREVVLDAVVLRRRLHENNMTRRPGERRRDYFAAVHAHLARKRGE